MSTTLEHEIAYIEDPEAFYAENKHRLDAIGGSAFHQPAEEFGRQVAERFSKADIAQSICHGHVLVGFALYKLIRGHLWRCNPVC